MTTDESFDAGGSSTGFDNSPSRDNSESFSSDMITPAYPWYKSGLISRSHRLSASVSKAICSCSSIATKREIKKISGHDLICIAYRTPIRGLPYTYPRTTVHLSENYRTPIRELPYTYPRAGYKGSSIGAGSSVICQCFKVFRGF